MLTVDLKALNQWLILNVFKYQPSKIDWYWTLVNEEGKDIAGLTAITEGEVWIYDPCSYMPYSLALLKKIVEKIGATPQIHYLKEENKWFWSDYRANLKSPIRHAETLETAICLYAKQLYEIQPVPG